MSHTRKEWRGRGGEEERREGDRARERRNTVSLHTYCKNKLAFQSGYPGCLAREMVVMIGSLKVT